MEALGYRKPPLMQLIRQKFYNCPFPAVAKFPLKIDPTVIRISTEVECFFKSWSQISAVNLSEEYLTAWSKATHFTRCPYTHFTMRHCLTKFKKNYLHLNNVFQFDRFHSVHSSVILYVLKCSTFKITIKTKDDVNVYKQIIMRPSSLGGAAYCVALCLSVCPSVCLSVRLSVRPSRYGCQRHVAPPSELQWHTYFSASAKGRISYGHLGRTSLFNSIIE